MLVLISIIFLFQINCKETIQKSNIIIKAAIFDLDGTLIDTQGIYDETYQMLINKYGNGKPYTPEYKMFMHGASAKFGNRFIKEQFNLNITLEEFTEIKNNYLKERLNLSKPMEGAKELTNNLKHKYRLKTMIATSSFKDSVEYKLSFYKKWIDSDFDMIITGEDKRIKSGKPSPDIFLLSAKSLGVDIQECIIFEDSLNGIKAAISSGAGIVVALPGNISVKYKIENFEFNRYRTKLIILKSLKDFDYSILD